MANEDVAIVDEEGAAEQVAEEDENTLTVDTVTKYTTAAEIANKAIAKVLTAAVDGAKIFDLCSLGDSSIVEAVKPLFNKKKGITKGISFPTCVSVGNTVCHLSPSANDAEASVTLKTGDTVRVVLGAHIDGYAAHVAHTIVVGASKEQPITGKKADVMQAAYVAAEAAIRLLRPGKTNYDVTDVVKKVAEDFGCNPVEGMISAGFQRNNVDGKKQIVLNPSDAIRKSVPTTTFEEGEVYSLDILISSGDGKAKTADTRTTVYKRRDKTFGMKTASARTTISLIKKDFGNFPFALRQFADEKTARMGMIECQKTEMVDPLVVLYEKDGVEIGHLQITVLLLPTGPLKITGVAWDQELVKSELSLKNTDVKELIAQPIRTNKKKKKKAAAEKSNGADIQ